ncbi:MAG: CvpA family protein [Pseudomonadota bacterium]
MATDLEGRAGRFPAGRGFAGGSAEVLSWVDFALIFVIGASIVLSLFRGVVREALSLLGWFVAFWVCFSFVDDLVPKLSPDGIGRGQVFFAFVLLLVVVFVVFGVLNFALRRSRPERAVSTPDRVLATGLGAIRGGVMVVLLAVLGSLTSAASAPAWTDSMAHGFLQPIVDELARLLPNDVAQHFGRRHTQ